MHQQVVVGPPPHNGGDKAGVVAITGGKGMGRFGCGAAINEIEVSVGEKSVNGAWSARGGGIIAESMCHGRLQRFPKCAQERHTCLGRGPMWETPRV